MARTATERDERLRAQLDWVRLIESFDEESAELALGSRLRETARSARRRLELPAPWPGQPEDIKRMCRRASEIVRFDRIAEMMAPGDRILDVGCGHGIVAGCIAKRVKLGAYVGVDLSAPKAEMAAQMAAANDLSHILRFEHGDAADLPEELVRALAPDIVLLLEVLEHVNDPIAVLQAVSEITETDPLIIFSVPLKGRIEACWGHRAVFGVERVLHLVEGAGLELEHIEELHNTWALVAVSRSGDHPRASRFARARSFEPTPIPLVDNVPVEASMAAVSRSTMLERPRRLHVVGAEGQMVECRFPASGMNLARIEIAFQNPGDIEGVVFEGLDRRGRVVARWASGSNRAMIREATATFTLRPGWKTRGIGEAALLRKDAIETLSVQLSSKTDSAIEATIGRVGVSQAEERDRPAFVVNRSQDLGAPAKPYAESGRLVGHIKLGVRRLIEPRENERRREVVAQGIEVLRRRLRRRR